MEDDTFVAEALVALADRAPIEPVGLAGTIESRFTRRRRRRWIASGMAAAVAVGLAIIVPVLGSRGSSPVWRLAAPGTRLLPIEQVWPGIVIDLPTKPLDGFAPAPLLPIDSTHLLIIGLPQAGVADPSPTDALAVYDTVQQTYHEITQVPDGDVENFAVSAHWVVWAQTAGSSERFVIYRAPLAGGPGTPIATVDRFTGPLYATDTDLYWTEAGPDFGIRRQPMDGGPAESVRGAEGMSLPYPHSPWAALVTTGGPRAYPIRPSVDLYVTRELRNVVTGQDIQVRVPRGTTSLQCTPQLCVGNAALADETGAFIQRPDGSDRSPLPLGQGDPVVPYPTADRTILLALHPGSGHITWCAVADPTTGRAGILAPPDGTFVLFNYDNGTLVRYGSSGNTPSRMLYYLDGVR